MPILTVSVQSSTTAAEHMFSSTCGMYDPSCTIMSVPLRAAGTIQSPLSSIFVCLNRCSKGGCLRMSTIFDAGRVSGCWKVAWECRKYIPSPLCMADAGRVVLGAGVVICDFA